jgi:hypothetical protein
MRPILLLLSLSLAPILVGCTGCDRTDATAGDSELIVFSYRTGPGCAEGCAITRPMLPGTEERIQLDSNRPLDGAVARSRTPAVAAAWIEESRMCCGAYQCAALGPAEACPKQVEVDRMLVVRALSVGDAIIAIETAEGEVLDVARATVADAASLTATSMIFVMPPGLFDTEIPVVPLSQGRSLERLEMRLGQATFLRLDAYDDAGEPLQASRGIGVRSDDTALLRVGAEDVLGEACGAASEEGLLVRVSAAGIGETRLHVVAGTKALELPVTILPGVDVALPTPPGVEGVLEAPSLPTVTPSIPVIPAPARPDVGDRVALPPPRINDMPEPNRPPTGTP